MTTQEIANRLVKLSREGNNIQAMKELYSTNIKSYEPEGSPYPFLEGIDAILEKERRFKELIDVLNAQSVSDPLVADDFFSVTMGMDILLKNGTRMTKNEICVFGVSEGKIVVEHYYYLPTLTF